MLRTDLQYEYEDEKKLLLRIAEGNEEAFRQLVHHYTPLLSPFILQLTKSREKAQEIVQDIFLQVWTGRDALAGIRHFRAYLFLVSRNHALNCIRQFVREEKRRLKWLSEQPLQAEEEQQEDYSPFIGLVEEAVLQLPEQQQKVWILVRRHGKKYQEVAEEMGISRETVKKYLQYAARNIIRYVQDKQVIWVAGIFSLVFFHKNPGN